VAGPLLDAQGLVTSNSGRPKVVELDGLARRVVRREQLGALYADELEPERELYHGSAANAERP
jgi:hypothetical protein